MKHLLVRFVTSIENAPLTLGTFLVAFLGLIIARLTVESAIGLFPEHSLFFLFFEFTHTFLFFLSSYLIILPLVSFAGSVSLKKAANVLLFGFLIILTPPMIDKLIFGKEHFWSFYEFDGLIGLFWCFLTLFGDSPNIGITYGVRVEVVLVTLALGLYTYLKSKRIGRALLVALLTYTALFILGTFPSWITLVVLAFEKNLLAIGSSDVAAIFLSPEQVLGRNLTDFRSVLNFKMSIVYALLASALSALLLYRQFPPYFLALRKNARVPQLLYHAGLLFLGLLLASIFAEGVIEWELFHVLGVLILLLAVLCAWLASVVANDIYDTAIDTITNPKRPLIEGTISPPLYMTFGALFFATSLLLSGIVSFSASLILLAYQALAWLYSAPPLRLKKYPVLATATAAFAGILVLIAGFVAIASDHSVSLLPIPLVSYLFFAYVLILPLKDFKDIEGDKKDHIYTLPVLLGEARGKQVIGSLMFFFFAMSPLVLNMRTLFLPAIFFGALAFFVLEKSNASKSSFFSFQKLPGLILVLASLYALVIIFFLH